MFSPQLKKEISDKVQAILQEITHDELPKGEINFILHVDGAEDWSWANIRNEAKKGEGVPSMLTQNLSV